VVCFFLDTREIHCFSVSFLFFHISISVGYNLLFNFAEYITINSKYKYFITKNVLTLTQEYFLRPSVSLFFLVIIFFQNHHDFSVKQLFIQCFIFPNIYLQSSCITILLLCHFRLYNYLTCKLLIFQVYHYCHFDGRQDSFLCSNGTVFNQKEPCHTTF
jgi:hypothetical protein